MVVGEGFNIEEVREARLKVKKEIRNLAEFIHKKSKRARCGSLFIFYLNPTAWFNSLKCWRETFLAIDFTFESIT